MRAPVGRDGRHRRPGENSRLWAAARPLLALAACAGLVFSSAATGSTPVDAENIEPAVTVQSAEPTDVGLSVKGSEADISDVPEQEVVSQPFSESDATDELAPAESSSPVISPALVPDSSAVTVNPPQDAAVVDSPPAAEIQPLLGTAQQSPLTDPAPTDRGDSHFESPIPPAPSGWRSLGDAPAEPGDGGDESLIPRADDLGALFAPRALRLAAGDDPASSRSLLSGSRDPRTQCGLNLEMMVDVSGSVDGDEMREVRKSALEAIDKMAGTPTHLGIHTFGSVVAPCFEQEFTWYNSQTGRYETHKAVDTTRDLDMANPADVEDAKARISSLLAVRPIYGNRDMKDGVVRKCGPRFGWEAATNWGAAFDYLRENAAARKTDAAIFMTDGVPTRPNGPGNATSTQNLTYTYDQAQQLKDQGVSVFGLGIGLRDDNGSVIITDTPNREAGPADVRIWSYNDRRATRDDLPGAELMTFYDPNAYRWTDPDRVTWRQASRFVRIPDSELRDIQCNGSQCWINKYNGWRPVYKTNGLNTTTAMETISDVYTPVSNFSQLTDALASMVEGCDLQFFVEKTSEEPDNKITVSRAKGPYPVTYKIEVTNSSGRTGAPQKLIEHPRVLDGLEIVSVTINNTAEGKATGDLLTTSGEIPMRKTDDGYVLDSSLAVIPQATRVGDDLEPHSKFAYVTVTYQSTGESFPEALLDNEDNRTCSGPDEEGNYVDGKGLTNAVDAVAPPKDQQPPKVHSGEGCVSIDKTTDPEYQITKETVGNNPLEVSPDAENITATYKLAVRNTNGVAGTPIKVADNPVAPNGLTIKSVTFSNDLQGQGPNDQGLLTQATSGPMTSAPYEISRSSMNDIAADAERVVYVTVEYTRSGADLRGLRDDSSAERCSGELGDRGKALKNSASVTSHEGSGETTDDACTTVTITPDPEYTTTKTPTNSPITVPVKGGDVTVTYNVVVANTNNVAGKPSSVVEQPQDVDGLTVKSVTFAGGLVDGGSFAPSVQGNGANRSFVLPEAKITEIPAGGSATASVTVVYRRTGENLRGLRDGSTPACEGSTVSGGKGIVNKALAKNTVSDNRTPATGCATITVEADPEYQIAKTPLAPTVTVPVDSSDEVTVRYKVVVTNTNNIPGTPKSVAEDPQGLPGMTVTNVVYSNAVPGVVGAENNTDGLINGEAKDKNLLEQADMVVIPANGTRIAFVTVTYSRGDAAAMRALRDSGNAACSGDDDGKGLVNRISLVPSEGNTTPVSGRGCTSVEIPVDPTFAVTKTATNTTPVVVDPESTEPLVVEYRVVVANTSPVSGIPHEITDSPSTLEGLEITGVEFANASSGAGDTGDLLRTGDVVPVTQNGDTWTVPSDQLSLLDASATKYAYVRVTYRVSDKAALRKVLADDQALTCDTTDDGRTYTSGRGLINRVNSRNIPGDQPQASEDEGCTSIARPEPKPLTVQKTLAEGQQTPVLIPGQPVAVTYVVSVTNPATNILPMTPEKIQDRPGDAATVTQVMALQVDNLVQGQSQLLKETGPVEVPVDTADSAESGTYALSSDALNAVAPGDTGVVLVTVYYQVDQPADTQAAEKLAAALKCDADSSDGDSSRSKGLFNSARLDGTTDATGEGMSATACIDAVVGDMEIVKKINDDSAHTPDQAVIIKGSENTATISYEITNTGDARLKTVALKDLLLQSNSQVTDTEFDQRSLSCDSDGVVDEGTATVTFPDGGLEHGQSATCSWTQSIDQSTYDLSTEGLLGDQITGTPGFTSPDDPETPIPGDPKSSDGWLKIGAKLQLAKEGLAPTVALTEGGDNSSVTVAYKVAVTNEGLGPATLNDLVEKPNPAAGISVNTVRATGMGPRLGAGARELLKDPTATALEFIATGDTYTLPSDTFIRLNPGETGELLVIVDYDMSSVDVANPAEDLLCSADIGEGGKGAANGVSMTVDSEDNAADGCVSVTTATGDVVKKISNQEAHTQDTAVPVIEGTPDLVPLSYTFTNTGTENIASLTMVDVYTHAQTGEGDPVPGDLTCTASRSDGQAIDQVQVTGDAVSIGDGGLATGDQVTCTRQVTAETLRFADDTYHEDTVTITPEVSDGLGGTKPGPRLISKGWAVVLPPLDGTLPDTGGIGVRWPLTIALIIITAGVYLGNRRLKQI